MHDIVPEGARQVAESSLARAVWTALEDGITLNEIAAYSRTRATFYGLCVSIVTPWPELYPLDLFADHLSGTPFDALRWHTALIGDITRVNYTDMLNSYVELMAMINDIDLPADRQNARFLHRLKPRIAAAIRADHEQRLDPTLHWPDNGYLEMVREYVKAYKKDRRLLDLADLIHGPYHTSDKVAMVLLDAIDDSVVPLITRHFPNARVIKAKQAPIG